MINQNYWLHQKQQRRAYRKQLYRQYAKWLLPIAFVLVALWLF